MAQDAFIKKKSNIKLVINALRVGVYKAATSLNIKTD
jgi:hypothetical protein